MWRRACDIVGTVNKLPALCLCGSLVLGLPASTQAVYADDNPFVEAMLRMREIFGLIDRSRLPLGAPYLPIYGQAWAPATGGLSGLTGLPLLGAPAGVGPMTGLGTLPAWGQVPGAPGWPAPAYPGAGGPGGWPYPGTYGAANRYAPSGQLDGVWELNREE